MNRTLATALNAWAAFSGNNLPAGHAVFATITTATSTNAMLPREIAPSIAPGRLAVFNVFREAVARSGMQIVTTTTAGDVGVPVIDTSPVSKLPENALTTTENTPTLDESFNLVTDAYQSGWVWMSDRLLQADPTIDDVIDNALYPTKEAALETDIASSIIGDAAITQVVTIGSTTALTFANLDALNRALPGRYRRGRVMFLSPTAFDAAENLADTAGNPQLARDPVNPEFLRFRGTLVMPCDAFQTLAANHTIGAIVSMVGFRLRDANHSVAKSINNPSRPAQVGFNLQAFHAFGYAKSAVAKLKTPAS